MSMNHKLGKSMFTLALVMMTSSACTTAQTQPQPASAFPHPAYTTLPENGTGVHETPNQMRDDSSQATASLAMGSDMNASPSKRAIQGHCDVEDQGTLMPCSGLIFMVVDPHNAIVSEIRTSGTGDFVFYVQYQQGYRLKLKSDQYVARFQPTGRIFPGSVVQIRLKPRAAKNPT